MEFGNIVENEQKVMELRKVRAENQCKQYQCLAFLGEQEGKVVTVEIARCLRRITMLRVLGLILQVA